MLRGGGWVSRLVAGARRRRRSPGARRCSGRRRRRLGRLGRRAGSRCRSLGLPPRPRCRTGPPRPSLGIRAPPR
eukprot:7324170-Pyramimonas_sp.AAC.1